MANPRPNHAFVQGDFNTQLYEALRQSPWWLTSCLIHVVVFGALMLLNTGEPVAQVQAAFTATTSEQPLEVEPPHEDSHIDEPVPMPEMHDPKVTTEPTPDAAEDDVDMPFDETFGEESDFDTSGTTEGPAVNSPIGIGPGGGGPFGKRGGNEDKGGGGRPAKRMADALDDALEWLAMHQSANGSWGAHDFADWCDGQRLPPDAERPDGRGKGMYDVGVTGLAVCAFLGAGYSNRGQHRYNRVVGRGLRYLKNVQDPEGCFGPRGTQQYIYSHAIASLAMVEAYGMTGSSLFKGPAQRALDFIALARNPYMVWRYGIKPGDNDTSVTGWMMMALKSASIVNASMRAKGKPAPLTIDESAFDGIQSWLRKVTDPDSGRVGYLTRGSGSARPQELIDRFPADKTEAMTAVGVLARVFAGQDPRTNEMIRMGADQCLRHLPRWNTTDGSIDMYYWYYATLAMFQVGGNSWKKWSAQIEPAMVAPQRKDGTHCLYKGSWDPVGPWGADGGRVYSTAVMAMCLEVHYRYARVFTGAK